MPRPEVETSIMHILIYTAYIFLYVYIHTHTHCIGVSGVRVFAHVRFIQCSFLWIPFPRTQWQSLGQEACGRSLSGRSLAQCHHQQGGLGTKATSSIIAWCVWEVVFACAISCASLIMSLSLWTPARFRCLGGDQDYRVFLELWDQLCVGSVSCHT